MLEPVEFPRLSAKEAVIMELLSSHGAMTAHEIQQLAEGGLKKGTVYTTLHRMKLKQLTSKDEVGRWSATLQGKSTLRVLQTAKNRVRT